MQWGLFTRKRVRVIIIRKTRTSRKLEGTPDAPGSWEGQTLPVGSRDGPQVLRRRNQRQLGLVAAAGWEGGPSPSPTLDQSPSHRDILDAGALDAVKASSPWGLAASPVARV